MLINIQDKEIYKAIKEFSVLSQKEMTFVAYFTDTDSPLRRLPEEKRRKEALGVVGINSVNKNIEKAIKKYKELQGWNEYEVLEGIDEQIRQYNQLLKKRDKTEKEDDLTFKVIKELSKILEVRRSIFNLAEGTEQQKQDGEKQSILEEENTE